MILLFAYVAATTSETLVQLVLGGFGVASIVAAAVAVVKLRPDANAAAVTTAGENLTQALRLRDEAIEDREYWRERALKAERELETLRR